MHIVVKVQLAQGLPIITLFSDAAHYQTWIAGSIQFNARHYIRVNSDRNVKHMQSSLLIMAFLRDFTKQRFLSIK